MADETLRPVEQAETGCPEGSEPARNVRGAINIQHAYPEAIRITTGLVE